MAIKPPSWAKNAIPTSVGWKDPRSGELLKATRLSQSDIDAYMGVSAPEPTPAPPPPPAPEPLVEDGGFDELEAMTKVQLEELGREHGVELDRRLSKATLVEQMREIINS